MTRGRGSGVRVAGRGGAITSSIARSRQKLSHKYGARAGRGGAGKGAGRGADEVSTVKVCLYSFLSVTKYVALTWVLITNIVCSVTLTRHYYIRNNDTKNDFNSLIPFTKTIFYIASFVSSEIKTEQKAQQI